MTDGVMDWVREILSKPTATVPQAVRVLGIGKSAGYEAARTGQIPTLRFGRRLVVPTAWLREQLGIETGYLVEGADRGMRMMRGSPDERNPVV
jgi:hypothetical protein